MLEVTLRTPFTLSADSLAAKSSATLSVIATLNGSVSIGLFHSPTWLPGVGASCTGRNWLARLARACSSAARVALATESLSRRLVAAKPHAPSTSVRTPSPKVSVSLTPCTMRSRVFTFCWRRAATRTSAYEAPPVLATSSAACMRALMAGSSADGRSDERSPGAAISEPEGESAEADRVATRPPAAIAALALRKSRRERVMSRS